MVKFMMKRIEQRLEYIEKLFPNQNYEIVNLPADASIRTYHRIVLGEESYILMDDNSKNQDIYQFYKIDKLLEENQIRVPKIIEEDLTNGFMLLEDLGDGVFSKLLASGENEEKLYEKAVDVLIGTTKKIKNKPEFVPFFDEKIIKTEISELLDWYYPFAYNKELSIEGKQEFYDILDELMVYKDKLSNSLVIWDYHIDNLMIDRDENCVVLDFQDSLWGSMAHDILCLLEDARREVPEYLQEKMLDKFIAAFPYLDKNEFLDTYKFFSFFRHSRVIGRFARLNNRDKKSSYLKFIPHCFIMLNHTLKYEKLSKMKSWFDKYMPEEEHQEIKVFK